MAPAPPPASAPPGTRVTGAAGEASLQMWPQGGDVFAAGFAIREGRELGRELGAFDSTLNPGELDSERLPSLGQGPIYLCMASEETGASRSRPCGSRSANGTGREQPRGGGACGWTRDGKRRTTRCDVVGLSRVSLRRSSRLGLPGAGEWPPFRPQRVSGERGGTQRTGPPGRGPVRRLRLDEGLVPGARAAFLGAAVVADARCRAGGRAG